VPRYAKELLRWLERGGSDKASFFLTKCPVLGSDTPGDSGGPIVRGDSALLVGITSFGKGCADPNYPVRFPFAKNPSSPTLSGLALIEEASP
jgi:hypothetical protein